MPEVFGSFNVNRSSTWLHHLGFCIADLINMTHPSQINFASRGARIHAFGEAAEIVVTSLRHACTFKELNGLSRDGSIAELLASHINSASEMEQGGHTEQRSFSSHGSGTIQLPPPMVIIFSRGKFKYSMT
ncbi:unnamed protein product [Protopolystoma xenopodis]|uniref:Uncharacterized protein n=1 Tax=Protopolystoma xenopodis TaxID=117903 RepID=A0A448X034_9PLAT|nr:unnamed protein product [Protopolystoma xenopodis]